jgi:hypothetical protein
MTLTRPEQASLLREDRDRRLLAIRNFVYHKGDALAQNMGYANVTGEVFGPGGETAGDGGEGEGGVE